MRGLPGWVLITGMMLWVVGCVTLDSQHELSDARAALEAARSVGAEAYSAARYRRAQDGIRQSERELIDGHQEMSRALAREARENAEAAEAETLVIKAREKGTATRAIAEVRQQEDTIRQQLTALRDRGALEEDLSSATALEAEARSSLTRAQSANDRGDSQSAMIEVTRVRRDLGRIKDALPLVEAILQEREKKRLEEEKKRQEEKEKARKTLLEPPAVIEEPQGQAPPPEKAAAPPPPETYTVRPGDSLWIIASRPEVYNNPHLWPLIFSANEATLKNPDLLRAGQKLIILRNYDEEQIREAERKARYKASGSPKDKRD